MNTPNGPVITGVHHVCLTVTDLDTSMNWYQQLFQAERWPGRLPHYAREETGFAEMLGDGKDLIRFSRILIARCAEPGWRFRSSASGSVLPATSHSSRSIPGDLGPNGLLRRDLRRSWPEI
jgi:hypothetical protein